MDKTRNIPNRASDQQLTVDDLPNLSASALYSTEMPATLRDRELYRRLAFYQFIYSLCGLILGFVCILGGLFLFFHGVSGNSSWVARIFGSESQISDAAPGSVLFVVGLFVVVITRFSTKLRNKEAQQSHTLGQ